VTRFTRAIVCPPAATFAAGITSSGLGPPDLALALDQHHAYCRALEGLGLSLVRLAPDPDFPDCTFVEDVAVVTRHGAIVARPGAASRAGEVTAVKPVLSKWFPELAEITAPGTVDAGDVCEADEHFLIGVSYRTNPEGAAQLAEWLARHGFSTTLVDIRALPGLLHLKSGMSWLGERRLLAVAALAGHDALRGWEIVRAPTGEDYAANCILVNDALLVAQGFPVTNALLDGLGYDLAPIAMSEYQKMDGGLSCLSIRW
jgi:dimethylargininase